MKNKNESGVVVDAMLAFRQSVQSIANALLVGIPEEKPDFHVEIYDGVYSFVYNIFVIVLAPFMATIKAVIDAFQTYDDQN